MDTIARIRAEIERLKDDYLNRSYTFVPTTMNQLLEFLDTLSEEPDKSREEEAGEYASDSTGFIDMTAYRAFIAGAEWQEKQDLAETAQSKSPLSVAYANRCFENGKQAMKQQMLKDALEATVCATFTDTNAITLLSPISRNLNYGDKVRIVVLKAEEE